MSQTKTKITDFVNNFPNIIKTFSGFIKSSIDENGKDGLDNMNGVIGTTVKVFGKKYVDDYFEKTTQSKLENFGANVYLQGGITQAGKSLYKIIETNNISQKDYLELSNNISIVAEQQLKSFDINNILTIFRLEYHPIISLIKNNISNELEKKFTKDIANQFIKHFNENIEMAVKAAFGEEAYPQHIEEIKEYMYKKNEAKLLNEMFNLKRIGFKENEDLKYEVAFGKWVDISDLHSQDKDNVNEELEEIEKKLVNVEHLIEEYYYKMNESTLNEILFIIADFGKGKSVFLRQYASKLAKQYIEKSEGYIPIYFNLRNYGNHLKANNGGVIADYLLAEFNIDISNEEFKNKKYFFLIDSLDESGELNRHHIEEVIESIKQIYRVNSNNRDNRVIVTSRPFEDGLATQIKNSKPFNDSDRKQYFLSMYGFKKDQFNDWISNSLENYLKTNDISTNDFSKSIIESIIKKEKVDIFETLVESTLSIDELKRPIFSYMIYQLIINNIDFTKIGKIGIYLSFLNLLTKEAKHIDDEDSDSYKEFNLKDEIESRNILHSISALWMHEKQQGKQGTLHKADIFRVLKAEKINDDNNTVLSMYKDDKVADIKFLSHSYFGANEDQLHFQHQSFAEILLAEYYLKIVLKYALEEDDDDVDVEEARRFLSIGEPTEQTMLFFTEMLKLLKESIDENYEIRKLLFPLLASSGTKKYNRHHCTTIYHEWLKKGKIDGSIKPPQNLIEDWFIDDRVLNKIINLSRKILESKKEYLVVKATPHTTLFDNEVLEIEKDKLKNTPHNIDKWLALVVGNILHNNEKEEKFFNATLSSAKLLFEMMNDWSYIYRYATPNWASNYFVGIDTSKNEESMNVFELHFKDVDFSYSKFKKFGFYNSIINTTRFSYCSFVDFNMRVNNFPFIFDNIRLIENSLFNIYENEIAIDLAKNFFPDKLLLTEYHKPIIGYRKMSFYEDKKIRHKLHDPSEYRKLSGFFIYGLKKQIFTLTDIQKAYRYDNNKIKEEFFEFLENEILIESKEN